MELDPEFPGKLGMEREGVGLVDRAVEDEVPEPVALEAAEELLGGNDTDEATTELDKPEWVKTGQEVLEDAVVSNEEEIEEAETEVAKVERAVLVAVIAPDNEIDTEVDKEVSGSVEVPAGTVTLVVVEWGWWG